VDAGSPKPVRQGDGLVRFDLGSGSLANYGAMGITYSRMDKVFLNHLHADHVSDLTSLYCFGPVLDRKWPLYVWGQGPSGVESPTGSGKYYDDGVKAFCGHFREVMRWHTEGQSYLPTTYPTYFVPTQQDWHTPVALQPVGGDDPPRRLRPRSNRARLDEDRARRGRQPQLQQHRLP